MKISRFIEEIKKFFATPKNIVIMVLGPLFFTCLFGYVYSNDYLNRVPMAVLDMDQSSLSRSLIDKFDDNERYELNYIVSDMGELESVIESKEAVIGLFIPPDFEKDIKSKKGATAAMIIDGTNIAIGNNAMATGSEILNTVNAGITISFLEGKSVPPRLASNYAQLFKMNSRTLWDEKLSYKTYILPGMILVLVQQLFLSIFVVNYIEDRSNLVEKSLLHIVIGAVTYGLCFLTLKKVLHISLLGNVFIASGLVFLYLCCLLGIAITIGKVLNDRLKATQFCMMMSLPSFLTAGYVWPAFKMPVLITGVVKALWPLIYLVSPLRDYIIKGVFPVGFQTTLLGLVIFGILWMTIGVKAFKKTVEV
ncbi:MAG: ABC transporter permease [Clostridia bacterium]|nr:ABC transporter permease [Clostridia bacterium]